MGWHLEHRPKNLEDISGNKGIVEALTAVLLDEKKRTHSYLFTGPSGSGKTTFAQIIANHLTKKEYNIHEINCSNDNGIETARQIIQNANKKMLDSSNVIYILDEVQRLSSAFQNSILKILEDTPKHIFFILCTTEPERLLKTIKSRCTHYTTKPLEKVEMVRLLKKILKIEGKTCSKAVINAIIDNNDCLARACITSLESIINIEDEEIQLQMVYSISEEKQSIELCRALIKNVEWDEIQNILKNIVGEPESIRYHILSYMNSIMLSDKTNKALLDRAALIMNCFQDNYYDVKKAGLVISCYNLYIN